MIVSGSGDQFGELSFKLGAAIGLDDVTVTKVIHEGLESCFPILGGEAGSQDNLALAGEYVQRRV